MVEKIKKAYALTDTGAIGIIKASLGSFLMYTAYMLPISLLMFFSKNLLDGKTMPLMHTLLWIGFIAIIMYVLINIAYETTYNETYKEAKNLRIHIAEVLKNLPMPYFSKHNLSDLSQTVMADVSDMEHALSHAIPEMYGFTLYMIFIGILLLTGNFTMGLVILVPIVLSFSLLMLSKKMQVDATTRFFFQKRDSSELFQESIELQQEIKSYNRVEEFEDRLLKNFDFQEKLQIRTELLQAIPNVLVGTVLRLSLGLAIITGSYLFAAGKINLLYLIGYVVASARMIDGAFTLILNMQEIMYLDARVKRIRELYESEVQEGEDRILTGFDIRFEHVGFSYNSDVKVIDDVSFTAEQNKVTALIGPSGCGKTTILRLMSRLYDNDSGKILIDQRDIREISTKTMYENISIVFQDVALFNTTIMDNIRLGRESASDEEVLEAARIANCDKFIEKLPDQYQTIIGENGMKLSGGERQRISIARAILKNAPIILLDEISSALDVENESEIQEGLRHLIKNKTVVIISHRLRSVQNADKIILMNGGKISDQGTHEELLERSELYAMLRQREASTEEFAY